MALQQGLLITVIGMGLVFLMIIALWGIMAGMVAIFKDKEQQADAEVLSKEYSDAETQPGLPAKTPQADLAAAVAVAYAMAVQNDDQGQNPGQVTSWNPSSKAYQPFRHHKGW